MKSIRNTIGGLGNLLFKQAYLYARMRDGKIKDVYVQDPKYFDRYKEELRVLFGEGIEKIDMVAIHVRRGDYIDNPFYVDLSKTSYYETAMDLFPKAKFLVFSDNIEWCKRQEIFADCEFSEGRNEVEDFNLMASCSAIICANSSYSWWAAFLSKGDVVAPKSWYADGIERTVCPKEWIRI